MELQILGGKGLITLVPERRSLFGSGVNSGGGAPVPMLLLMDNSSLVLDRNNYTRGVNFRPLTTHNCCRIGVSKNPSDITKGRAVPQLFWI